jgi:DNA-binding response OmpR family regulator
LPIFADIENIKACFMPRACLLAAHDPWLIQLLRAYTEEYGFRVEQAYETQEVLPIACKKRFSAILLQGDLPGHITGGELLQILYQSPVTHLIPVLVFDWRPESLKHQVIGGPAFLEEPVTYAEFVEALQKAGIKA